MPNYVVGFVQAGRSFLARLSAAATIACLPVLLAGWAAQDNLVRGPAHGCGEIASAAPRGLARTPGRVRPRGGPSRRCDPV